MRPLLGYRRVLVVTAVDVERAAVLAGLGATGDGPAVVVASGVGPAAAAACTAHRIAVAAATGHRFDAVVSAGIAGGFAGRVEVGGLVLATETIAADLGAAAPDGFLSVDDLGFGTSRHTADPTMLERLCTVLPEAVCGPVLTVSTVTGTAQSTEAVQKRHPDAVAEGMEGFGVATGAQRFEGTAFGEIRAISNAVGPRDRAAWRISDALDALRTAFARLAAAP